MLDKHFNNFYSLLLTLAGGLLSIMYCFLLPRECVIVRQTFSTPCVVESLELGETRTVTAEEEHILRVSEEKLARKIFGAHMGQ